jgi:hypothetical protein
MHIIRASSLEEYASWYLQRNARKGDTAKIPKEPEQQVQVMWQDHCGKMRSWFRGATRWNIVSLDDQSDLANLVFLESEWTKRERLVVPGGKNYRLLSRVAANAIDVDYVHGLSIRPRMKENYDKLTVGSLLLQGEDRIAICSAEQSEIDSNPAALYYLLDGAARCLPYMILLKQQKLEFTPIEGFLAARERA